jgi:hypothetical protein
MKDNEHERVTNMVDINTSISTVALNVNDINTPIKRQRLSLWIKSRPSTLRYLLDTYFKHKGTERLKAKGWKTHINSNQKKARVTIHSLSYNS